MINHVLSLPYPLLVLISSQLDPADPVYILELGAGHGKFSTLFLRYFSRLLAEAQAENHPLVRISPNQTWRKVMPHREFHFHFHAPMGSHVLNVLCLYVMDIDRGT